jgi:tetratricopeptide (TPR) repeat protein
VKTEYEWDWLGAEREYRRAIALNANYGTAHQWYAMHLGAVGRVDEALMEIKQAREAEPLSPTVNSNVGWYYYVTHQFDAGIEESMRAIALDPNFAWGHNDLGSVYLKMGRYPEAIAELEKGLALSNRGVLELAFLAHAYAVSGQERSARRLLDELRRCHRHGTSHRNCWLRFTLDWEIKNGPSNGWKRLTPNDR